MDNNLTNKRQEIFQKIKFQVLSTITDSIIDSTIQFFYDDKKGNPKATGSGILLEVDERYFALTAAHVIAEHYNDIYVIIPNLAIYLGGMLYHVTLPTSGNRIDDKIDLAIIELDKKVTEKLKTEYKFISLSSVLLDHSVDESSRYLILGYPATKTKKVWNTDVIKAKPFVYNSRPALDFQYKKFGFDIYSHIAIAFKKTVISKTNNRLHFAPDLKGISGCGVWYLPDFPDIEKLQEKKLIGIVIECINMTNNQAIILTRIDMITEFIRQNLKIESIPISKKIKINIK